MARFDDAQVGDKVKAPALDRDAGRIVSIQEHEAEYPITINFPNYGHITITRDGKFSKYSLISATFYTNDAGDLLTERPKRKVKKEIPCQAWLDSFGDFIACGAKCLSHNATLIVEVDE